MLYALGDPLAFLGLAAGFLLAVLARGVAQAALARALGGRGFDLPARTRPDPRRHIDPFGAVAALLAGPGWGTAAPIEGLAGRYALGRARGRAAARLTAVLLAGPVAAVLVTLAALLPLCFMSTDAVVADPVIANGTQILILDGRALLAGVEPSNVLHGPDVADILSPAALLLLCAGIGALAVAVMELLPIPPLDGGRLVLALAPTTVGWQRVRGWADSNWGVVLLLVILLLPIGPDGALAFVLVDALGEPLLELLGG